MPVNPNWRHTASAEKFDIYFVQTGNHVLSKLICSSSVRSPSLSLVLRICPLYGRSLEGSVPAT